MTDLRDGVYIDSAERNIYLFDNTYNIKYNSQKGLYAVEQITKMSGEGNEDCFLYHVYIDLLFEAVGMLNDRFIKKEKSKIPEKIIDVNIKNYTFDKIKYPIISRKDIRNFIIHIDERYYDLIRANNYYGTFNVIFKNMEDDIENDFLRKDRPQNNLLNLKEMKYRILDPNNGDGEAIFKEVNLMDLKGELEIINKQAEFIWGSITSLY